MRRRREGVPETAAAVFGAGGGGGAAAVPQLPARHVAGVRAARHQAAHGLAVPAAPLQELQPHRQRGGRFAVPMRGLPHRVLRRVQRGDPFRRRRG